MITGMLVVGWVDRGDQHGYWSAFEVPEGVAVRVDLDGWDYSLNMYARWDVSELAKLLAPARSVEVVGSETRALTFVVQRLLAELSQDAA